MSSYSKKTKKVATTIKDFPKNIKKGVLSLLGGLIIYSLSTGYVTGSIESKKENAPFTKEKYISEVIERSQDPLKAVSYVVENASQFKEGFNESMNDSDYKKAKEKSIKELEKLKKGEKDPEKKEEYQKMINTLKKTSAPKMNQILRVLKAIGEGYENMESK